MERTSFLTRQVAARTEAPHKPSRPIEIPKRRKTSVNTYVRSTHSPPLSPDMIFEMSPPQQDEACYTSPETRTGRFMYQFPTMAPRQPFGAISSQEQHSRTLSESPAGEAYFTSAVVHPHLQNRESIIVGAFGSEDEGYSYLASNGANPGHAKDLRSRSRSRAALYKKMSAFSSASTRIFPTTDPRQPLSSVRESTPQNSPEQVTRGRRGLPKTTSTTIDNTYLASLSPSSPFRRSSQTALYPITPLPPTVIPSLASTITTSYSSLDDASDGEEEEEDAFAFDKYLIQQIDDEKDKREGAQRRVNPLLRKKENIPRQIVVATTNTKLGALPPTRRSRESVLPLAPRVH